MAWTIANNLCFSYPFRSKHTARRKFGLGSTTLDDCWKQSNSCRVQACRQWRWRISGRRDRLRENRINGFCHTNDDLRPGLPFSGNGRCTTYYDPCRRDWTNTNHVDTTQLLVLFFNVSYRAKLIFVRNLNAFQIYPGQSASSADTVLDHVLHLPLSSKVIESEQSSRIPTGAFMDVSGTAYDFRQPRALSERWDETAGYAGEGASQI